MALIESGVDSSLWTIDNGSKAGRVTLYDTSGNPITLADDAQPAANTINGIMLMGMNDRRVTPIRTGRSGSIALATHTPLFTESFEGTTIHPIRWTITATTMAATQSSVAGLTINSGNITTITTGYMLKSNRSFAKTQRQPLHARIRCNPYYQANSVMEFGFGDAATFNGVNTTGMYWQITPTGVVQPVVTFNSVDITGTDISGLINKLNYYSFDIFADDDNVTFFCQDSSTGLIISQQSINLPLGAARLLSSTQIPAMVRCYNTGVAPSIAPKLIVTDFYVAGLDANLNLGIGDVQAAMHRGAISHQQTGVQSAAWANSAEPASATLSNTAAGYTTLGGKFQFAAVAGAVTDYALFGYQVPAPATLCITGIDIETWNTGAAVATTPTLLTWGIASNLTAVSLATANHERLGLGAQTLAVATPIGGQADRRISKSFRTPIVCGPGRYVDIILRMPVGTATASQVIAGMVNIEGFWL